VDPGNLLVLAQLVDALPVVGIPTCARSPKLNGFDFVLRRFAAGEPVTARDIQAMGVGGLLTEIGTRPMPRDSRPGRP
jgi:molybdenum cofactor cytidylyltransferase